MHKSAIRRELFPVTQNVIYLNHAAIGPLSEVAAHAMLEHAAEQRDWGAVHWRDWMAIASEFRHVAARLIGARSDEISILKNTTEGISFVASGLRWNEGENVITTPMEFPSNWVPWKRLERRGVECRTVEVHDGRFGLDEIRQLVDDRTRVVALSSASFHHGFAPDLAPIGEFCRSRDILFCVDAIQSVGAVVMDVEAAKIDFLSADAHKWMMGPEGTAIFYARAEVRDRLEVLESGWMNADRGNHFIGCPTDLFDDGRRFEGGTLNTNGIYGAAAAIELLLEIGPGQIQREVLGLAEFTASCLEDLGFEVRTPRPCRSGIVSAVPSGIDTTKLSNLGFPVGSDERVLAFVLHEYLEREGVICSARERMLRFSPHFYNTEEEIEDAVDLLRQLKG